MPAGVDQRTRELERARRDVGEQDRLLAERDLPARDARDVEQVVDQPDQVPHLPLRHLEEALSSGDARAEELEARAERGERVAQLVGEHGEELVLAAAGFFQRLAGLLEVVDICGGADPADEAAGEFLVGSTVIMVEYRDDAQRVFAGRQRHRLRRDGATFRIVQKRVDLINCDGAFEAMAVPI